jgi:hypothetical protein
LTFWVASKEERVSFFENGFWCLAPEDRSQLS